jgi:hypothetical protein
MKSPDTKQTPRNPRRVRFTTANGLKLRSFSCCCCCLSRKWFLLTAVAASMSRPQQGYQIYKMWPKISFKTLPIPEAHCRNDLKKEPQYVAVCIWKLWFPSRLFAAYRMDPKSFFARKRKASGDGGGANGIARPC